MKLARRSLNASDNDNLRPQPQDNVSNERAAAVGPDDVSVRHIAADIQRDFDRLRESLIRKPVPEGFKVKDNNTGIKKEDKPALKARDCIKST